MTLDELNVPNKFGTMPIFAASNNHIIHKPNGAWLVELGGGVRILQGSVELTFNQKSGYYTYHFDRTYFQFDILYLLPATPENILIRNALGDQ